MSPTDEQLAKLLRGLGPAPAYLVERAKELPDQLEEDAGSAEPEPEIEPSPEIEPDLFAAGDDAYRGPDDLDEQRAHDTYEGSL